MSNIDLIFVDYDKNVPESKNSSKIMPNDGHNHYLLFQHHHHKTLDKVGEPNGHGNHLQPPQLEALQADHLVQNHPLPPPPPQPQSYRWELQPHPQSPPHHHYSQSHLQIFFYLQVQVHEQVQAESHHSGGE